MATAQKINTVEDHLTQARKVHEEAGKLRAKGSTDIEDVRELKQLESIATGHEVVAQSLRRRQKKRRNMENGKA